MQKHEIEQLVSDKVSQCRADVDRQIDTMRGELHGLREEVAAIASTTSDINESLRAIARNMEKLADLPEAWSNVKGFFNTLGWFRRNWLFFVVFFGLVMFTVRQLW